MKVSNSRLNTFRDCPRAFFYKYVCEIEPITEGETEHDRSFGKAIHKGIECLYKGGSLTQAKANFEKEYPFQLDKSDLEKTKENGKKLIEAYWNRYSGEMKKWKIIAVEVLDEYEPIPGLIYRVRLDLVAENINYGGIYGYDWKTTGEKLGYRYWSQFNPNDQITTYFNYIQSKFGQCAGFYIDAMSFGFRQRAYKGEPSGFHYSLDRQLFTQTNDQILDWIESDKRWFEVLEESIKLSHFPKNTSRCRFCSYRPICAAGWSWESDKDLIECQFTKRSGDEQTEKGESHANSSGVS